MIVTERFVLNPLMKGILRKRTPSFGFGQLGAAVYHRTYSREINGKQENWADTIIRTIEGFGSIRKWWYTTHNIPWDEQYWQEYAMKMADAAFEMRWLPPGRGLQMGGTEYSYEVGAMSLQNCAATTIKKLSTDSEWLMRALMSGVGVGFDTTSYSDRLFEPVEETEVFLVPDSREGWSESVRRLIESYERGSRTVYFDYSKVRPAGAPIKRFGGVSAGPDPLIRLHERLRNVLRSYARNEISAVRLVTDVQNLIGTAVVSGGVRRTAEIALGKPHDEEFRRLKDFSRYNDEGTLVYQGTADERVPWGYTSNNSIQLWNHEDFEVLPEVAEQLVVNGEPGLLNMINIQQHGRFGERMYDPARLINPCGEQPLEDKEVCCLAEVFVNRCKTTEQFYEAIEFATAYASTVTLLPTDSMETNRIIEKNRRIGVSISAVAEWITKEHVSTVISKLRKGYKVARETNKRLATEARVPESIRVTTVKPSGSVSQLAGASPGVHYPQFGRYIRRMRVQEQAPIVEFLINAGVPHEQDVVSENTIIFEFPINLGKVRGQREVTMWQKGAIAMMMQQHWSDNAVSTTVTFSPKNEGSQVGDFLAFTMPQLKSISMLPIDEKVYAQMPYEEITLKEYEERAAAMPQIDWSEFVGSDGEAELYCTTDYCEIR